MNPPKLLKFDSKSAQGLTKATPCKSNGGNPEPAQTLTNAARIQEMPLTPLGQRRTRDTPERSMLARRFHRDDARSVILFS